MAQDERQPSAISYWLTVAVVLLALCPNLIVSTGLSLMTQGIMRSLHTQQDTLNLASTFSNAGFAFGAVLAAELIQRLPIHRLFLAFEALFVLGSLLTALAPSAPLYIAGHVLQGLATGLLLVVALPPLITGFSVERLSTTAGAVNIGLFGAVTAGPLIGGFVAQAGAWRWFFGADALAGAIAFALAIPVLQRRPPTNPGARFDAPALLLAAAGAALSFYGIGELTSHRWTDPIVWVPALLGLAALAALIVAQYFEDEPLMPVKPISTTFPLIGIIAAAFAGAAFSGMLELVIQFLQKVQHLSPQGIGELFWPAVLTAAVSAVLFGLLLQTRFVLVLPLAGLLTLAVAAWMLLQVQATTGTGMILWVAGLLGLGAGLAVSPGLFMAALSVAPNLVGRAFALVELLRLCTAYLAGPILLYAAGANGKQPAALMAGLHNAFWATLALTLIGIVLGTAIFIAGGARLHPPRLDEYIEHGKEALDSPPVTAAS